MGAVVGGMAAPVNGYDPEEVLLRQREYWIECIEGRRPGGKGRRLITDTGFGMGQADIVYETDGWRVSVTMRIEGRAG